MFKTVIFLLLFAATSNSFPLLLDRSGGSSIEKIGNSNTFYCNFENGKKEGRSKRFMINDKWDKMDLTYSILNHPTNTYDLQNITDLRNEIERSFKDWTEVSDLQATRVDDNADIHISFTSDKHSDGFDFSSSTLAHASGPRQGIIHFNNNQYWASSRSLFIGPSLRQVATHEVGHVLGLGHSSGYMSVMRSMVSGVERDFKLAPDDVEAVVYLYGSKKPKNV